MIENHFICIDGGLFDIDGNVTKGPQPRPLDQFKYTIEEGNIYIYLKED